MFIPSAHNVAATGIAPIAKGGMILGQGIDSNNNVLAVGGDHTILVADSTKPEGVAWRLCEIQAGGTGASSVKQAVTNLGLGGASAILVSVPNVDLKAVATTQLFVVPNNTTAFVTDVIVTSDSADTVTQPCSVSVGRSPNFNDWSPISSLGGLNVAGRFCRLSGLVGGWTFPVLHQGDALTFDVTTGATATALTGTVHVFGFLL